MVNSIMGQFIFHRPPKVHFGRGSLNELAKCAAIFGNTTLLLTGASSLRASGTLARIESQFLEAKIEFKSFVIRTEPSPDSIDEIVTIGKKINPNCVIAIGGGSVIDAGKAVSAMLPSGLSVKRFLEDVGAEKPSGEKAPFIAVPTTFGTGSEATANAVLSEIGSNGFKKSLRHVNYTPDTAIVDPDLAAGCPQAIMASCGMDAFTQLLESYVSSQTSPMTDALAVSGIERVRDCLVSASSGQTENPEAREGMAYAALMSGIALANAGLGAVHGLAAAIGGRFPIPHGAICGALVGPVTGASIKKLRSVDRRHPALCKYASIGHLLSNTQFDTIENGCDKLLYCIDLWTRKLAIPSLCRYGIVESDLDGIVAESSNKNNPIKFDMNEIKDILIEAL
jgi:alcohol dehydrogenase